MDKNELTSRIYDKLFDMVGFSENHVDIEHDIEITDQYIENNEIYISINKNGFFDGWYKLKVTKQR